MIETPEQKSDLGPLVSTLQQTAAAVRAAELRTGIYRLLWQWLALIGVLFVLDIVFALPAAMRLIALVGQVLFLAISAARLSNRLAEMPSTEEWAARQVELRHPEVDNALINAIQFARTIDDASPTQSTLMERELDRARRSAESIPPAGIVDRAPERTAARNLAFAAGAWALLAIVFWTGVVAVVPRLFAPWMDDVTPPFSLTHFNVRPAGASVQDGESLTVEVTVTGQAPDTVDLMFQSYGAWQRIPMESAGSGEYSASLDSLHEDAVYYVQANTGRSGRYHIIVTKPPVVTAMAVTYTYPTYTNRPASKESVGESGIHGLAGTVAALDIHANRPLMAGQVTVQRDGSTDTAITVAVDPKDNTHATVPITISRPGKFDLSLQSTDGQANHAAFAGKIALDVDQRPNVWIVTPAQDILVTPSMRVPIQAQAEDDQGIQSMQLHRMINDISDVPRDYPSANPKPQDAQEFVVDLPDLGVRPGDRIAYYATAFDTNPGTPNIGETETYTMKVVSEEEYKAELAKERTANDIQNETSDIVNAVSKLAEDQKAVADKMAALQKALAKNPGDKNLQKQLAQARQDQKDIQAHARKLAQAIKEYSQSPSSTPLEKALKDKLAAIAQQMSQTAAGPMQSAQNGTPSSSADQAKKAADQLKAASAQMTQQVQKSIQYVMEVMPLFNDVNRFMELLNQQGQLVLRAREFQDSSGNSAADKAKLDELASQQASIRQALKELQDDFRHDADTAQEHFPKAAASARRIAGDIDKRKILDLMQAAKDKFGQWNGPEGFVNAKNALAQMQAMVGECNSTGGNCKGELDIALKQSLGKGGLGNSLDGMGMGSGDGQGMGFGVGGMQTGRGGNQGGSTSVSTSAKAYVPSTQSLEGTGGDKKIRHANHNGELPGTLAPSDVEVIKSTAKTQPKNGDRDVNRFPPEYRKMIGDYFKSVAESKGQ